MPNDTNLTKESEFAQGPILSKLLKFMLPILAALILQTLYSAVDLLVVGQFSTTASVSGVSMGSQIVGFMTYMIAGMSTAVTVILGRCIGEKNTTGAGNVIGSSIFFFSFLTIIIITVLCVFPEQLLNLINMPAEAMSEGVTYTVICGAGYVFITAYNLLGSIFRGMGDSKTPLLTVGIACVVNIGGDLLLVGVFKMAAAGAAIATVFAQAISVALSLYFTKKKGVPFEFGKANIKPHWSLMWKIAKTAFPLAVNEVFLGLSFMVLSAIMNELGLVASAAVGVTGKLSNFIMIFTSAFSQSLSAFVAHNIGAGKLKRAQKSLLYAIVISIGVAAVMFFFSFFHGTWLTQLFSNDPEVVQAAADFLKAYAIDTFFTSIVFCTCGYCNGLGKTNITMIQCFVGIAARMPAAFILRAIPGANLFVIGLCIPISTICQLTFLVLYLLISNNKLKAKYAE